MSTALSLGAVSGVVDISGALRAELEREPTHLYEITAALSVVDEILRESEGVLTPEAEAYLDALNEKLENKVDGICTLRQNKLSTAKALKEERERLHVRETTLLREAESLRAYLYRRLSDVGITRIETTKFTVREQANSAPSVVCALEGEAIPVELRKEQPIELDKSKVLAMHKAGQPLPEGIEVVKGKHLRIA